MKIIKLVAPQTLKQNCPTDRRTVTVRFRFYKSLFPMALPKLPLGDVKSGITVLNGCPLSGVRIANLNVLLWA